MGNCKITLWNCYKQVKEQYLANLRNGFLLEDKKSYHPALETVILVNEPDLKFSPPGRPDPKFFVKAIVSALDALLDAEKEAGVSGLRRPNITATFSFALCGECPQLSEVPG